MTTPRQGQTKLPHYTDLVHPIYRYLWPTPQSIFYPVSHRIPTDQALYAQYYSTVLFRYIYIDGQSNSMRQRSREKTEIQRQSALSSHPRPRNTSRTRLPTESPRSKPTSNAQSQSYSKRSKSVFKIAPSPRFPHHALVPLLLLHLGFLRYPASSSTIDLNTYRTEIAQDWSLTRLYSTTPPPHPDQEPPQLLSEHAQQLFQDQMRSLDRHRERAGQAQCLTSATDSPVCQCELNQINPRDSATTNQNPPQTQSPQCLCGYIPMNQREQLHEKYRSSPKDRMIYTLVDEHRTPFPYFESAFLADSHNTKTPPLPNQQIALGNADASAQQQQEHESGPKTTDLKDIVSTVHSILKTTLPTAPSTETNEISDGAQNPTKSEEDGVKRKAKPTQGSRSIMLKEFDLDTMMSLIAPSTTSSTSSSPTPAQSTTTETSSGQMNDAETNTSPANSANLTPQALSEKTITIPGFSQRPDLNTINKPVPSSILSKVVRSLHPKHRSKILNSTQYLIFASQLQRDRFIAKKRDTDAESLSHPEEFKTDKTDKKSQEFDASEDRAESQYNFTHQTTAARSFYNTLLKSLRSKPKSVPKTQQNDEQSHNTDNSIGLNGHALTPSEQLPPTLASLAFPSYQAFNNCDQFLPSNCILDTAASTNANTNSTTSSTRPFLPSIFSFPSELSGNVSAIATATPQIVTNPVVQSQMTPSSVVISCSPEKPEVWGCLLFALGILNTQILQSQAISKRSNEETAQMSKIIDETRSTPPSHSKKQKQGHQQQPQNTMSDSTREEEEEAGGEEEQQPIMFESSCIPPINTTQPTSLKVETALIDSLHRLYSASPSSTSTTTTSTPSISTSSTPTAANSQASTTRFQKEYQTMTINLPKMSSFYDSDVYQYIINGLQMPTNTLYLPTTSEVKQITHVHSLFNEYRQRIAKAAQQQSSIVTATMSDHSTTHPDQHDILLFENPNINLTNNLNIPLETNKQLFSSFFDFLQSQSFPLPFDIQQRYQHTLMHSFSYPLLSSPTSPLSLFHFSFDTDASPFCYVPKAIQGLFAPTSTRLTLGEHRNLLAKSFRKKNPNTMGIPTDSPSLSSPSANSTPSGDQSNAVGDNNGCTTTTTNNNDKPVSNTERSDAEKDQFARDQLEQALPSANTFPNLPYGDISFNMLWSWRHSTVNHQQLHLFQKVNHFQRSGHLTRKDALSKNISRFIPIFTQLDQKFIAKAKHCQEQQSLITLTTSSGELCDSDVKSSSNEPTTSTSSQFSANLCVLPSPRSSSATNSKNKSLKDTATDHIHSLITNPLELLPSPQPPPTPTNSALDKSHNPQSADNPQLTAQDLPDDLNTQLLVPNLEIMPLSYVFPLDLAAFQAEWKSRQQNCPLCHGVGRVPKEARGKGEKCAPNPITSSDLDQNHSLSTDQTELCSCQLWIVKPVNSSRGRGIFISDDIESFATPYIDFYADVPLSKLYGASMNTAGNVAMKSNANVSTTAASSEETIEHGEKNEKGNQSDTSLSSTSKPPTPTNQPGDTMNENDKALNFAETTAFPPVVVQHYVNNPLLLHKRKFDLRLYVMVTSFDPLEAYVYNEGYARFAGNEFSSDINDLHGHLTNSSLNLEHVQNKDSNSNVVNSAPDSTSESSRNESQTSSKSTLSTASSYTPQYVTNPSFAPSVLDPPSDSGNAPTFDNCKQLFSEWVVDMIETFGPKSPLFDPSNPNNVVNKPQKNVPKQPLDAMKLLKDIDRVVLNSLLIVAPRVGPQSNAFEVFGYDIMIDDTYRPWLLEVNSSPSMNLNTDIDTLVKPQLMADSISLLGLLPFNRVKLAELVSGLIETNHRNDVKGNGPNVNPSAKSTVAALTASANQYGIRGFGGALMNTNSQQTTQTNDFRSRNKSDLTTAESTLVTNTVFQSTNNSTSTDKPAATSSCDNSNQIDQQFPHLDDTQNQLFSELLSNFRTRFYGELPVNIGQFRRIAPNGPGSIFAEQNRFKVVLKKYTSTGPTMVPAPVPATSPMSSSTPK